MDRSGMTEKENRETKYLVLFGSYIGRSLDLCGLQSIPRPSFLGKNVNYPPHIFFLM
jgi:hypothetical protein